MSKPRREPLSVRGVEPVGPYTLVRLERGNLSPGTPGQFFMVEAPGCLLPRPLSLCLAPSGELAFLIDPIGPGTVALQNLAGYRYKATAMAIVLFVTSVLGLGLGPLTIGLISDALRPNLGTAHALQTAILIAVTVGFASAFSHWFASLTIKPELESLRDAADPLVDAAAAVVTD